jgi:hypothetical protein
MWNEAQSLTTPGPDISFNTGAGDDYVLIPSMCRWVQDTRLVADPVPRGHGLIIFPALRGGGHLYLGGLLKPGTDTPAARDAMHYALEDAIDSLYSGATGTYSQPSGRGTLTVTVEQMPGSDDWNTPLRKTFSFVLVAAAGWV